MAGEGLEDAAIPRTKAHSRPSKAQYPRKRNPIAIQPLTIRCSAASFPEWLASPLTRAVMPNPVER